MCAFNEVGIPGAMNPNRPWAAVSSSPTFMRRVNGWLTIFWIVMIPISLVTGWIASVTYVAVLSLWALVSGPWAAWQAARVEVHQDEDANVQDVLDELRDLVTELRGHEAVAHGVDRPLGAGRQLPLG